MLYLHFFIYLNQWKCFPGTEESSSQTVGVGTTTYAAPEQKENSNYTNKVSWWKNLVTWKILNIRINELSFKKIIFPVNVQFFKANKYKDFVLVFLLLTLSRMHTLFWCFRCWLWTIRTCRILNLSFGSLLNDIVGGII